MRVAILGFGLIGGSIARALHDRSPGGPSGWSVVAWSPSGTGPARAADDGVIARAAADPPDAIDGAELVILAGPVPACLDAIDRLAGPWRDALPTAAVVTDVASTKRLIVERATDRGLRFVGGHPMAGRETVGYAAADPALFVDRPWVVVPSGDQGAVRRVEALVSAVGARPVSMTARDHDAAVAAISHLPLLTAAALVEAVTGGRGPRDDWPAAQSLAATGWRDMTRLARGDVAMGTGIIETNAPEIAARLRDLIAVLEAWLADLDGESGPDATVIRRRLTAARDRLEGPS
jgi:prephenate dehydrogenase